jgi:MFS family permease
MYKATLEGAWAPLRHPVFRAMWLAAIASNIGSWMHSVGAAWLMTILAPSPLMVALVTTATSLPTFLFGLLGGSLADLADRRRILLYAQSFMLAVAALLGVLAIGGWVTPWWLLFVTFSLGTAQALNAPAWQMTFPELAPRTELPAVVALNGVQFNIARAVGPALGGLIIAATNPGAVFLLNAASFLGVILVLWQWRPEPRPILPKSTNVASAIHAGLRYAGESAEYQGLLVRVALYGFAFSALWALLPVAASQTLRGTSTAYGVLLGLAGIGAIVGAAVHAPMRASTSPDMQAFSGILLGAVSIAMVAVASRFWLAAVGMAGVGASWMIVMSTFNVRAQTVPPPELRARSLAMYMLVHQGAMALGASAFGSVASHYGVSAALLASAAATAGGLITAGRLRLSSQDEEIPARPVAAGSERRLASGKILQR